MNGKFNLRLGLEQGKVYAFKDVSSVVSQEHIVIRANRLRCVQELKRDIEEVAMGANISAKSYVLADSSGRE